MSRRGGTDMRFQPGAAHDVNGAIEQARDVLFQSHIIEHRDTGLRLDVDDDVEVAVGRL